jgi:hypothetical protein
MDLVLQLLFRDHDGLDAHSLNLFFFFLSFFFLSGDQCTMLSADVNCGGYQRGFQSTFSRGRSRGPAKSAVL